MIIKRLLHKIHVQPPHQITIFFRQEIHNQKCNQVKNLNYSNKWMKI